MMISDRDYERMSNDVSDTIRDWHESAIIMIPKPLDQQINWNPLLRESNGSIEYNTITDVPIERVDGFYVKHDVDVAGDRNNGSISIYIPQQYRSSDNSIISIDIVDDMIMIFDGYQWRPKSYKKLIGEYLVNIIRLVGGQ